MALFFVLFMTAVGSSVFADEIWMKNGDRITGKIEILENRNLTIQTPYAGQIVITWDQVKTVETTSSVHVVLDDATAAHGMLKPTNAGNMQLETNEIIEPLTFDIGQVKGINSPPPASSVAFSGRVNAGLDARRGNTDTQAYHIDGEISIRTKTNRYTLGGQMNREEESDNETVDNRLGYLNFDHYLTQKAFCYASTNFEQDDLRDLNLRTTIGGGAGYQFFESEWINLLIKGGVAYVKADYSADDQDNDYTAGRWAAKYDQFFFNKSFQLFHFHEVVQSFKDKKDILIHATTGLSIPLQKGFMVTLQHIWDWDNAPVPDTDRANERYLLTLGYHWQ
jgi:putative salt-induced outer membrane protein YdiY